MTEREARLSCHSRRPFRPSRLPLPSFPPPPSVLPAVSPPVIPAVLSGNPSYRNPSSAGIQGRVGGKRKDSGCPITTVGHDRREAAPALPGCPITLVPDVCCGGTVGHDRERGFLARPSRRPSCHSRKFLAGIHLHREKRKDSGCPITTVGHDRREAAPALPGCPITLVPDVCYRGTVGHDRVLARRHASARRVE